MSEWWTYSLSDFLLFSPRTYYRLFELYNAAIWPAHLLALAVAAAILALLLVRPRWQGPIVAGLLALAWIFVGRAFILERYLTINWAAEYLAWGFFAEAILLVWLPASVRGFRFAIAPRVFGRAALALFVFALAVHPLVGPAVGRPLNQAEVFGIAPDPTAVATLGVALTANRRSWLLLILPLVWCALSGATAWAMKSPDALLMPVCGAIALVLAVWKSRAAAMVSRRAA